MARWPLKEFLRRLLPKTVRSHRIITGRLRGFRMVTSWHDYPAGILGTTERPLLDWFERNVRPGETWLDVGAHYGYTAIALCRLVGRKGRVFAFEPSLATAGHLARTRTLNNFRRLAILPFGLGSPNTLQSYELPTLRGMMDSTSTLSVGSKEPLLLARFDWLWSLICDGERRIDGVKVDAQGMELEILRGMTLILREFAPKLVIELHRGVERGRLLDLLESLGYSRACLPVDPRRQEAQAEYLDDNSYSFQRVPTQS